MKRILLPVALLLGAACANGQDVLHNSGNLQIHSGASLCSHAGFTNSSTGSLVNNGNLYVKGNVTNDQSSMGAGTGVLYLNGSAVQSLNGTQSFKTYQVVTNNAAGITLNNNLSVADGIRLSMG